MLAAEYVVHGQQGEVQDHRHRRSEGEPERSKMFLWNRELLRPFRLIYCISEAYFDSFLFTMPSTRVFKLQGSVACVFDFAQFFDVLLLSCILKPRTNRRQICFD